MPLLVEPAEAGAFPIHGIIDQEDDDAKLAFLDRPGDPYTGIGWGVYGVPETFVVDAEGRIGYKHVGPFDRQSLEADILPVERRLQAEGGA